MLIAVNSSEGEYLLGMKIIQNGRADTITALLVDTINSFDILNKIKIICDTTNVNTGKRGGVVKKLKDIIPSVLYHPCRLHIQLFHQTLNITLLNFNEWLKRYIGVGDKIIYPKSNRNDYSELAALCEAYKIKLLSGHNPNIDFKKPGALSRARWNSRAIYLLKYAILKNDIEPNIQRCASFVANH
ncbi:hypothetical protein A3Q56_07770, partial [Intoshia linei]